MVISQHLLDRMLAARYPHPMTDLFAQYWPLLLGLAASGIVAGTAAGLFGIGGGAIIVPVLFFLFEAMGYGETAMHVAVATSLATIILTSGRSVMAHHQKGAVDWAILKSWAPWIMAGSAFGMVAARWISGEGLTLIFGTMAFLLAAQLFFGRPTWKLAEDMPGGAARAALGAGVGGLSSIMGIGGGTFGVSLMTVCGKAIHKAVATAAGFGIAIGLPGTLVAIWAGWGVDGRPPLSLGYVNLAAFALISVFTVAMAPVGAMLAHKLNAALLRRSFGVLLAVVAARMLWKVLAG